MYENIEQQLKSGKSLTQSRYYSHVKRELWPKFFWEMYPLAQEYYHELNPYFCFHFYRPELIRFSKTVTVRDGYVTFAQFMLKHFSTLDELGTHFIIHPSLAPLVPPNLTEHFSTWKLVQPRQTSIQAAKRVIVFGPLCEQYLGDLKILATKLEPLKLIRPGTEVDLYLPLKRNPLQAEQKESLLGHEVICLIKDALPGIKLKFHTNQEFFEKTDFNNHYFLDLAADNFIISDNYMHYYIASRGGTVSALSSEVPSNSLSKLALSFNHDLHIMPFPKVDSVFIDLLFYRKQNPGKELSTDPGFHRLLKDKLQKKS